MPADTVEGFRSESRAWLEENADRVPSREYEWGEGSDSVAVFHNLSASDERAMLAEAMAWQRRKFDAGFGAISFPEAVGGRGLDRRFARVFAEEERNFQVPPATEVLRVSLGLVAPTLVRHDVDGHHIELLRRLLRGEVLVCQLFSEPAAGSDLASLRCRAMPCADSWVVRGQKVWTSGAAVADHGELIVRTNDGQKHGGLTAFVIPMDLPGIEVRPIRQMTGGASFNEVFFDDVVVEDRYRLGAEGEGWMVTLTTLAFEREVSGDHADEVGASIERVLELARHLGGATGPIRQRLADLWCRTRVLELHNRRVAAARAAGSSPGPEGSIGKLLWTENLRRMSDVVAAMLGPRLTADTGEWGTFAWTEFVLGAPGYRIAGGSDEIQRTIIAERGLGLPRERMPDR